MKPTLYPSGHDFKRVELFDGSGDQVGIRLLTNNPERMSESEWDEVIADIRERFAVKAARRASDAA